MSVYIKYSVKGIVNSVKLSTSSCHFARKGLCRRPIKVLNVPSEETSLSSSQQNTSEIKFSSENVGVVGFSQSNIAQRPVVTYEKLQANDSRFSKALEHAKLRKFREKKMQMLLEGKRLINDAIKAGIEMETLFFSREKDLTGIKLKPDHKVEVLKVLYRTMSIWSDLTTSTGVMAIFKRPTNEFIQALSEPVLPVTIICDNIREPGNLGAIIRNSAAAGCKNILLMKGCVDPWESKVLRTGCGGHFRIPLVNDIEWTHIANYLSPRSKIYIADNSEDIELIVSTPEYISYDECPEEYDEPPKYITLDEKNQPIKVDETFTHPKELEKYDDVQLPCYLYSGIRYPKEDIVVYVGGETHGVDARIVKLACEYGGKKVKIPLENNMESLNSSFALTLILYEIKRQLTEKYVLKEY